MICSVISVFGVSYYLSIKKFWYDWTNKAYEFKTYLVAYDSDIISDKELYDKISNENISDIYYYYQYNVVGTAFEYKSDEVNGEIQIIGTVPNTKKIKYGRNVENDYEVVCPSKFLPSSKVYESYNSNLEIDMKDKIGTDLKLEPIDINNPDMTFKIVGLYDETYDYSYTNECFTNHSTIEKINRINQPKLFENQYSLFILANDYTNFDSIKNIEGVVDIQQMQTIKTSVGTDILKTTSIMLMGSYIATTIILILLFKKNMERKNKSFGIMLSIGYDRNSIKQINNIEIIIILLVSTIISTIILYLLAYIFPILFLKSDIQLCRININVRLYLLILNLIVSYLLLVILNRKSIKLLEKNDIKNIVRM